MSNAQPPERIKWEEAVLRAICDADICRSDAQAIIETTKNEALLNEMFKVGIDPAQTAQRILD